MKGLSVRWSLTEAPAEVAQQLRDYVADSSHARFTGMETLRFKTWRMRPGEWFEGTYVFRSDGDREAFEASFRAGAASSPVSEITGGAPVLVEAFEVVSIAEGADGFEATPRG